MKNKIYITFGKEEWKVYWYNFHLNDKSEDENNITVHKS